MKPDSSANKNFDIFHTPISKFINKKHELAILADKIDWSYLEDAFAAHYADLGRPGVSLRLLMGLNLLKFMYNLSDERVCSNWIENPYYQYFCGEVCFQHQLPVDRSSMTNFRNRIGADELEKLLQMSLAVAHNSGALDLKSCDKVIADTTVQEKAITYPTDGKLRYKALERLAVLCKEYGIKLRQNYIRVGKGMMQQSLRYRHAKQYRRAMKCEKVLEVRLGRVIRDIRRKFEGEMPIALKEALDKAMKIKGSMKGQRIYSWHAPEVECIGKGKAHKPFEFGCKVSIVTNLNPAPGGHFVLSSGALHGKPYDGHTLEGAIKNVEKIIGREPSRGFVDKGYVGHKYEGRCKIYRSGQKRGVRAKLKVEIRRRSAVEPIIGHVKHDNRMVRHRLKGIEGDRINAIMAATGYNLMRVLAWIASLPSFLRQIYGRIVERFFANLTSQLIQNHQSC